MPSWLEVWSLGMRRLGQGLEAGRKANFGAKLYQPRGAIFQNNCANRQFEICKQFELESAFDQPSRHCYFNFDYSNCAWVDKLCHGASVWYASDIWGFIGVKTQWQIVRNILSTRENVFERRIKRQGKRRRKTAASFIPDSLLSTNNWDGFSNTALSSTSVHLEVHLSCEQLPGVLRGKIWRQNWWILSSRKKRIIIFRAANPFFTGKAVFPPVSLQHISCLYKYNNSRSETCLQFSDSPSSCFLLFVSFLSVRELGTSVEIRSLV